jgi:hypothetical protein
MLLQQHAARAEWQRQQQMQQQQAARNYVFQQWQRQQQAQQQARYLLMRQREQQQALLAQRQREAAMRHAAAMQEQQARAAHARAMAAQQQREALARSAQQSRQQLPALRANAARRDNAAVWGIGNAGIQTGRAVAAPTRGNLQAAGRAGYDAGGAFGAGVDARWNRDVAEYRIRQANRQTPALQQRAQSEFQSAASRSSQAQRLRQSAARETLSNPYLPPPPTNRRAVATRVAPTSSGGFFGW